MFVCDLCGTRSTGAPEVTATGRVLCRRCHENYLDAAAGMIAGGRVSGASLPTRLLARVIRALKRDG